MKTFVNGGIKGSRSTENRERERLNKNILRCQPNVFALLAGWMDGYYIIGRYYIIGYYSIHGIKLKIIEKGIKGDVYLDVFVKKKSRNGSKFHLKFVLRVPFNWKSK